MRNEMRSCDICGVEISKKLRDGGPFPTFEMAWLMTGSCESECNETLDLCLPCHNYIKPKITEVLRERKEKVEAEKEQQNLK